MPWHIVPDHADCGEGQFAVVADDNGEVEACHTSPDAATKHLAALYAAADDEAAPAQRGWAGLYVRAYPLDDIRVRAGGDGRTVEAYAAVFGVPTRVRDPDGEYEEELDPAAFRKTLSDLAPAGSRRRWRVGVFYNHGMTVHGSPSERASVPIGVPLDVKADSRGLFTVTRYHRGELADEVLEAIREGAIGGYSFTGQFLRSTPSAPPRGGYRRSRTGSLTRVRRLEATLREYGPTPFPVYADAAVLAVRAQHIAELIGAGLHPATAAQVAARYGTASWQPPTPEHPTAEHFTVEPSRPAAPGIGRAAPEEPHAEGGHSARSVVAWANTRAAIRTRTGVRRHAQEEEV